MRPISICIIEVGGQVQVSLSQRLHRRQGGSDFHVYPNQTFAPRSDDYDLLKVMLATLREDEAGIGSGIRVSPFELSFRRSRAVQLQAIKNLLLTALREAGWNPTEVDEGGKPVLPRQEAGNI